MKKKTNKFIGKKILLECDQNEYAIFTIRQVLRPDIKSVMLLVDRIDPEHVYEGDKEVVDTRLVDIHNDDFCFADQASIDIASEIRTLGIKLDSMKKKLSDIWLEDVDKILGRKKL